MADKASALTALEPVASRLRDGRATVAISGRTAPVGPGDGRELATCRAHAAADVLRSLNVPQLAITAVRGDGDLLDPPGAALDPRGRPDSARLAALRRVVFIISAKETP